MKDIVRPALISTVVFTVLLGFAYPACVGLIGEVLPAQAHGALVGQPFTAPGYFWGRPSAVAYDAMASGATNAGPTGFVGLHGQLGANPRLVDAARARIRALRDADPGNTAKVPVDLVTTSASGLDPHISPAAAYYQLRRVARARGVPERQVKALVDAAIEGRTWLVLGEPRVNVLALNLALDAKLGTLHPTPVDDDGSGPSAARHAPARSVDVDRGGMDRRADRTSGRSRR
jgi:K+-transporting ATPase ATPase C chain